MSEDYKSERTVTRVEAAEVLQNVALGVTAGAVQVGSDGDGVAVDVPNVVDIEVEIESEDGGTSLEVELEWPDGAEAKWNRADALVRDVEPNGTGDRDDGETVDGGPPAVGVAGGSTSSAEFELFTDRSGDWRWRLVHANGNIIADSGEGYSRKADALNGIESVRRNAFGADVIEQSD